MSASLWTWPQLRAALGAALALPERESDAAVPSVQGIALDSRQVQPGDLFIALKGDPGPRFTATDRSDRDGHDFVPQAMAAGAVAALVSRPHPQLQPEQQLIVPNTLDALWQLGAARRRALRGPIVAITGSSGKTTCKTFLQAALDGYASEGSLNNHLGVPLSLARAPVTAGPCVFELGMNHPGEIAPLSRLVRPQLAVVLNVHDAHAEAFANRAAIAEEKLSIAQGLEGPSILIVEESLAGMAPKQGLTVRTFGEAEGATVRLLEVRGDQARYQLPDQVLQAQVPGGGKHRALTLAAVLAVLNELQLPVASATHLPAQLVPAGRGSRSLHGGVELIDDSYNANPASMAAALKALADEPGRRYALLGEMLELGEQGPAQHEALAQACVGLDGLALVGEGMRALAAVLPSEQCLGWWPSVTEESGQALDQVLQSTLRNDDKLLIKGSNRVFWKHRYAARLASLLDQGGDAGSP